MKLTIKTLKGAFYNIEIDENSTILDLKQKIEGEYKHPVNSQQLVFSGKVLNDDNQILKDVGLLENSVIIFFFKKSKTPAAAPATATTSETTTPAANPAPATNATPSGASTTSTPTPTPASTDASPAPTSTNQPQGVNPFIQTAPPVDETKLKNLIGMGFGKELAKQALQAAFGNEDVAVQYCMDGIPADLKFENFTGGGGFGGGDDGGDDPDPSLIDNLSDEQVRQLAAMNAQGRGAGGLGGLGALGALGGFGRGGGGGGAPGAGGGAGPAGGGGAGGGGPPPLIPNLESLLNQNQNPLGHLPPQAQQALQALASNPQLPQLRQIIVQNPQQVETIVTALVQNNPQLGPVAMNFPNEFLSVLVGRNVGAGRGGGGGMGGGGMAPGGTMFGDSSIQFQRTGDGAMAVSLSPEDKEKVDNIKAITGKPTDQVIQAFVACGKNVESAINLLYDM